MSEQDTPERTETPRPDAEPLPPTSLAAESPAPESPETPLAVEPEPTEEAVPEAGPDAPPPDAEPLPANGPAGDEPTRLPAPEPQDEDDAPPQAGEPLGDPAASGDADDADDAGDADETSPVTPSAEAAPVVTGGEGVESDADDGPVPLSDADFDSALEALLLVVDSPVEEEALASALDTTPLRVAEHLRLLSNRYTDQDRGIDLRRAGGGWRFYTRDRYAPYVEKLLLDGQRAKLTRAALETLAVIAYRQPVTRARVAAVRGVNCDGVIRTLLARGLVEETGTDLETGGFLYRTTELFLERLGLSSLDDLPPIAPLLPEVDSIDEL